MHATRDFNLDRVSLDDLTVRRRSATVHFGGGTHPDTRDWPYWVYLGCGPIPERYAVSPRSRWLEASTVSGRSVRAEVRIVARHDDAYGAELILAGLGPLVDKA
jgi:hypothetical protein